MKPALAKARQVQAAVATAAAVIEVNRRLTQIEASLAEIARRLDASGPPGRDADHGAKVELARNVGPDPNPNPAPPRKEGNRGS